MNQQPTQFNRFRVMSALALAVLGVYLVVLFNIQVVHHDDYLAQSTQAIARVEDVKASRGIITDRSGRTLVSNQYTYSLTFDTSLLKNRADQNEAILRLVQLCREQNVEWDDNLPPLLRHPLHLHGGRSHQRTEAVFLQISPGAEACPRNSGELCKLTPGAYEAGRNG